ncbi:helix-turn-helix domain-containing protein [Halovenus rubra]|uniref:Helix-turn-helix domain-containing protein n=2 Tax=Halovenus rubra TaxID=869890 RepID=A0ACC7DVX9_9EURY|nr:helix-turn-helix domain-containing protein [Halovenus rubra]
MRYVKVRTAPADGQAFHPLGQALVEESSVERGNITWVEMLDDGTAILIGKAWGDESRYREILRESPYVLDFNVTSGEDQWYSYTHFEPTDTTQEMLATKYESGLVMEMPIIVNPDGSMEVTLVGPEETFQQEFEESGSDGYKFEIIETGPYHPDLNDLYVSLTGRQREVLDTALELGYYETPREATHEDIAQVVDISPSTVGEHLQKIEACVFGQLGD